MYSEESLRRYMVLAHAYLNYYKGRPVEELRVHISKGNTKIGHAFNVSLLAGISCGNCTACLKYCYDIKACLRFPEVLKQRAENTALLILDRTEFFRQIRAFLSSYHGKHKFFRWHQSGEIMDIGYLSEINRLARDFSDWTFWTYTKMYTIVNSYCDSLNGRDSIAKNLSIMFSAWDGVYCPNPYGFPEFVTIMKGAEAPSGMFRCVGNCDWCKEHHRGCIAGETTWNREH